MATEKTAVGQEMVPLEDAIEQVRRVCVRLGLIHLSFARTIVDELGEEKGKKLILKAIKDYGIRIGEKAKADAIAQGLDNIPANFKSDLPKYGMHEQGCVMARVWNEYGENELGRLYCYVDPAKYMAFNSNFKLYHLKTRPDGDERCQGEVRPTTEQERKDFADKDADWEYIDR